jgi:hypothetical protein
MPVSRRTHRNSRLRQQRPRGHVVRTPLPSPQDTALALGVAPIPASVSASVPAPPPPPKALSPRTADHVELLAGRRGNLTLVGEMAVTEFPTPDTVEPTVQCTRGSDCLFDAIVRGFKRMCRECREPGAAVEGTLHPHSTSAPCNWTAVKLRHIVGSQVTREQYEIWKAGDDGRESVFGHIKGTANMQEFVDQVRTGGVFLGEEFCLWVLSKLLRTLFVVVSGGAVVATLPIEDPTWKPVYCMVLRLENVHYELNVEGFGPAATQKMPWQSVWPIREAPRWVLDAWAQRNRLSAAALASGRAGEQ